MNKIDLKLLKSKYANEEHLVICVDDQPLDVILDKLYPDQDYLGLVPALSWLDRVEEINVANQCSMPPKGGATIAPILICPDDQDLWCTVIVADIEEKDDNIIWNKLGLDRSKQDYENPVIGKDVDWFDLPKILKFKKVQYEDCIEKLLNEYK